MLADVVIRGSTPPPDYFMRRLTLTAITAALLTAAVPAAHAGLLGTTLTANYLFPDANTVYSSDSITVGNSVEIQCTGLGAGNADMCGALTGPNQSVDFLDSAITYVYSGNGSGFNPELAFNGFEFLHLNPGVPILAVSLSTDIAGLHLSRITFTETSIRINMVGLQLPSSRSFTVSFDTAAPEPCSIALAFGGLAALLVVTSFRRRLVAEPLKAASSR